MPAELVKDDDVDKVTRLNRLYYIATQWRKALDEVAAGDMGRARMMAVSDSYRRAPDFGGYNRKEAYDYFIDLSRKAWRVIEDQRR
jgi:hypothetical protein